MKRNPVLLDARGNSRKPMYDIPRVFTYTARMRKALPFSCSWTLALILVGSPAHATEEPYNTGWLINLDNDIVAESDRDYTGGFAVTLSGRRAAEYLVSLEGVRNWLDRLLRVDRLYSN